MLSEEIQSGNPTSVGALFETGSADAGTGLLSAGAGGCEVPSEEIQSGNSVAARVSSGTGSALEVGLSSAGASGRAVPRSDPIRQLNLAGSFVPRWLRLCWLGFATSRG